MEITNFVVSQRDNALLVGDYNSYRTQSSRRLHTVRKRLGRTTRKGHKYSPKTPVTAEDIAKNHEYVHLLLLSSERAWANAMHMKTTHSADNSTKGITGSTRSHIISRLQKASTFAVHLASLLQDQSTTHATDTDLLEARAYSASLLGALNFEKQNWETCLREYSVSRVAYAALGGSTKQVVYKDLLENTIDPSIRYAAYQLKLPRTKAVSTIAIEKFPQSNHELKKSITKLSPETFGEKTTGSLEVLGGELKDVPKTITWRRRTVEIEDASIAQALAAAASAQSELSSYIASHAEAAAKDKAAAYDNIILASQDAVDATKTAIDELVADGADQGDKRMQSLQVTRTAVNYGLVGWRVGRNRILCGPQDGSLFEPEHAKIPRKARKDGKSWTPKEEGNGRKLARLRERVVLYDAILQSLDSVKELPGVAADEEFVDELEGNRAYFQSLRTLAIARSHAILSNTSNILALLTKALYLCSKAPQTEHSNTSIPKLDVHSSQSKALHSLLQTLVFQYHGLVELQSLSAEATTPNKQKTYTAPVIENLEQYPAAGVDLTNLVTYPPKLEPIPVKPLFFDIAWNYIQYPGRKNVVENGVKVDGTGTGAEEGKAEEKKETRRGWFGFGR